MTRIFFILFFLINCSIFSFASSGKYKINDAAVEQLFSESEDISYTLSVQRLNNYNPESIYCISSCTKKSENTQLVAGIIALGSWITGIGWLVPIHRFILGTDSRDLKIFCSYCVTLSGCGVILLVDGILLLLEDTGTKYINNSKFIMW